MATRNFGTLTVDLVARMGGFEQGLSQAERRAEDFNRKASRSFEKLSPATRRVNEATRALQDLDRAFESGTFSLKIDGMDELQSYDLMRRQLEDVKQSAVQAQAALGGVGSMADFQKLARQIDPVIGKLESLASQQDRLNAAFREGNVNEEEYQRLNTQLELTRREIDGTTAAMEGMQRAANAQQRSLDGLIRELDPVSAGLGDIAAKQEMLNAAFAGGQIESSQYDRYTASLNEMRREIDGTAASMRELDQAANRQDREFQSLIDRLDPLNARLRELDRMQDQLNQGFKQGRINTEQYEKYTQELGRSREAMQGVDTDMRRMGNTAGQTRMAMQQLPMQFNDIWVSLAAGQSPMMVFIQQGTQIKDSFGGAMPALRAMGGYVAGLINPFTLAAGAAAGLGAAFYIGNQEARDLEKSLIVTGNSAGVVTEDLVSLTRQMDALTGVTQRRATSALNEVVSAGKFTAEQFDLVTKAAINMQDATGAAIEDTIAQFADIAGDPVDAIYKLNQEYNFLTSETYRHIRALVDSGRQTEAVQLAMESYSEVVESRSSEVTENLGNIEKAWNAIKNAGAEAIDSVLSLGRDATFEEQISELNEAAQKFRDQLENNRYTGLRGRGGAEAALQHVEERIAALTMQRDMERSITEEEQHRQEIQNAAIDAQNHLAEIRKSSLSLAQKEAAEQEKLTKLFEDMAAAGDPISAEEQRRLREEISKQFEDTQALSEARRSQTESAREAAKVEREYQKALEASGNVYAKLFAEMSPAGEAQADYNATIAELQVALNAGTKSTLEYYAAVAQAAKVYNEAVAASDPYAKELKRIVDQYDSAYQRGMQLQRSLQMINQAWRDDPQNGEQYARVVAGIREEIEQLALEADPLAEEMARLWEEAGNRIDETFADAFRGAFDSFSSFSDQLAEGFKRLLAELAYQATLKPIVVGFTQDMQGLLNGSGSSSSSFGSLISGGRSLLGLGSSVAATGPALSGGFMGAAATQSAGSLYGMAATGGVAPVGLASSITSGISATMPWLAGGALVDNVLGLGIVDGIVSGLSGLFGGSPTPFSGRFGTRDSAAPGTFEHQGSTTEQFYQQSAFGSVGFLDAGTERLQRAGTGSKAWAEELAVATAEIDNLTASLAPTSAELEAMRSIVQGLETSSRSASEIVEFALNERPRAALEALGGHFGEFVRGLEGGIESVVQQAQLAQQAYGVLSGNMQRLNLQFDAAGAGAYGAASNIATLVGGTENLSSLLSGYYDAFYTEQEKFDNLASDLSGTFSEMGRELPTTREGVRSLVESLQLMGAQGQEQLATILQLNEPLNQYITALEEQRRAAEGSTGAIKDNSDALRAQAEIARERESLERQLLGLLGDQAEIRRRDLAATDESNRALQQRIWYINDENDVVAEAMRRQQERNQAIERESTAMAQARQQLASFGVSINDWLNNLQGTDQGLGTPADQLAATAQAFDEQYKKALGGDQAALGSITQYADRFIEAQKGWSASGDQTVSTIDRVSSMLEKLPEKLSAEQFLADEFRKALGDQTTSLLEGQSLITDRLGNDFASIDISGEGLIDWGEFYGAFSHLADEATLRQVFNALDNNGSGAIDKLEAISNGTQSLVDYWANQQPAGVQDAIAKITDMYQSALKREPDLPGMQYWIDQFLAGASLQTIEAAIKQHIGKDAGGSGGSAGGSMSVVDQWMSGQSSKVQGWAGAVGNIYQSAMGRDATVDDLKYWTGQLQGGIGLGTVDDYIRAAAYVNRYSDIRDAWQNEQSQWKKRSGATNLQEFGLWHAKNLGIPAGRQFADGGYTGPGGKYDPAGIVHAGEVVWSQDDISRFGGVGAVESLRNSGGISAPPLPSFPLLQQGDLIQVVRDLRDEVAQLRKENKEGQETIGSNTRATANAVANGAMAGQRLGEQQLSEARAQTRALRLEKERSF